MPEDPTPATQTESADSTIHASRQTPPEVAAKNSFMDEAVTGIIVIGSKKSILDHLNKRFPMKPKDTPKTEKFFYTETSFEDQIERMQKFNKYKNADYMFGVIYFYENTPPPLPPVIEAIPEAYRDYRIIRIELHK